MIIMIVMMSMMMMMLIALQFKWQHVQDQNSFEPWPDENRANSLEPEEAKD